MIQTSAFLNKDIHTHIAPRALRAQETSTMIVQYKEEKKRDTVVIKKEESGSIGLFLRGARGSMFHHGLVARRGGRGRIKERTGCVE